MILNIAYSIIWFYTIIYYKWNNTKFINNKNNIIFINIYINKIILYNKINKKYTCRLSKNKNVRLTFWKYHNNYYKKRDILL